MTPELTMGALFLLRTVGPRHRAGERFDPVAEIGTSHDRWIQGGPVVRAAAAGAAALDLAGAGLLASEGAGLWSLTEAGESTWKELAGDNWRNARSGAGAVWA